MNARRYKFRNSPGRYKISSEAIRRPNEMSIASLIMEFWQFSTHDADEAFSVVIEETGSGALWRVDERIELSLHIRSNHQG